MLKMLFHLMTYSLVYLFIHFPLPPWLVCYYPSSMSVCRFVSRITQKLQLISTKLGRRMGLSRHSHQDIVWAVNVSAKPQTPSRLTFVPDVAHHVHIHKVEVKLVALWEANKVAICVFGDNQNQLFFQVKSDHLQPFMWQPKSDGYRYFKPNHDVFLNKTICFFVLTPKQCLNNFNKQEGCNRYKCSVWIFLFCTSEMYLGNIHSWYWVYLSTEKTR